jgi:ATP-dependent protease ClpP protease subunit
MRKTHDPSEILAQVHSFGLNLQTREIYLHSHYLGEEEPGVEYRMATTFVKNLHILDQLSHQNILVHMHTVGGEWGDGMAIYDAIHAARSPVTILAYAQASSMSGIVLQAARKRVLMPNCEFVMHYGSLSLESHSIAAKSAVLWNDTLHAKMLRIFAEQAVAKGAFHDIGLAEVFFDAKMKETVDWFITGEQALQFGLADGIFGTRGFKTLQGIRK